MPSILCSPLLSSASSLIMFTPTKLVALLATALLVTALPSTEVAAVAAHTGQGV